MVKNNNFEIRIYLGCDTCNLMGRYIIDISEKPSVPYLEDFEFSRLDIH
jgi:hypothetical protein